MQRLIDWFEIPVLDFPRAQAFYEAVFQVSLRVEDAPHMKLGIFPYTEGQAGGALGCGEHLKPGADGVVIYLFAGDDLDGLLARVLAAGGEILMPRTAIGPNGYIALMRDLDGNCIGLHSDV